MLVSTDFVRSSPTRRYRSESMFKNLRSEPLLLGLLLGLSFAINVGLTLKIRQFQRLGPPTQLEVGA